MRKLNVALMLVCAIVFFAAAPVVLAVDQVNPGVDNYSCPQAQIGFGSSGCTAPLPAGFFEPGSDPFEGQVALQGSNFPPDSCISGDTIIQRLSPPALVPAPYPSTDPIAIEIVELSLTSIAPITVTYDGGQDPELWNVYVGLSVSPQPLGTMLISKTHPNGGMYDSAMPILPKFVFERQSDGQTQALDYGTDGIAPILLNNIAPYPWEHSPIGDDFNPSGEFPMLMIGGNGCYLMLTHCLVRHDSFSVGVAPAPPEEEGPVLWGSGSGYNDGAWYQYPSGWWNQWFYDHPLDLDRKKTILFTAVMWPMDPQQPAYAEIIYNWTTPNWTNPGPPMPEDFQRPEGEPLYIGRSSELVDPHYAYIGPIDPTQQTFIQDIFEIPDYNPEWISIDIRGNNFELYANSPNTGELIHVCDPKVSSDELALDFGDADDDGSGAPYPTLLASNGARHIIVQGVYMGFNIDADPDGQPVPPMFGDDLDSAVNDEDGVIFTSPLIPGQFATVDVIASVDGYLNAWVDFNNDGSWTEPGDQIFAAEPLVAGVNPLIFQVPASATGGIAAVSRWRFSTIPALPFTGEASNGEVEDHEIDIEKVDPCCQLPDNGTGTADFPATEPNCPGYYTDPQNPIQIIDQAAGPIMNIGLHLHSFSNFTRLPSPGMDGLDSFFDVFVEVEVEGSGPLSGFSTSLGSIGKAVVHTGPRNPGDPVQSFSTEIVSMDLSMPPGDPDFKTLSLVAGVNHGLPSPGHTTMIDQGDGTFAVDSFFDITYQIEFEGETGSTLDGIAGTTTGTIRMDVCPDGDPDITGIEYGDAPEGALAYPSLSIFGSFPTCINVGPAGWIQHTNFGAFFGPMVDFEPDGNAGACWPAGTLYDQDECWMDGDAGLMFPPSYTIMGPSGSEIVLPCSQPGSLGRTCRTAVWGVNLDIDTHNHMPNRTMGYVNVVMDWNQDGQWGGTIDCTDGVAVPEHVLVNHPVPNPFDGPLSLLGPPPFTIGPNPGHVWTRFTITERPVPADWTGDGSFEDGESECYLLEIVEDTPAELDFGDAPDPSYPTLAANNGARHVIVTGAPWFGDRTDGPDADLDGQPNAAATGDDLDGNDDEDGIVIPTLVIGSNATIKMNISGGTGPGGCVEAFIDFNGDGDWDDAGEALPPACYPSGIQAIDLTPVPVSAVPGITFARFRITSQASTVMTYQGQAPDGEVEDHMIEIVEEDKPDITKFEQLPLDGPEHYGHDELSTIYTHYIQAGETVPGGTPIFQLHGYEGCYMADDFADKRNTSVDKITWWGSYLEEVPDGQEPVLHVDRFMIVFETDVPAIGQPGDADYVPSHPGEIISTEVVELAAPGALNPGEYSEEPKSLGGPPCNEPLYEYHAVLERPFHQEQDTVYWLKIVAIVDLPPSLTAVELEGCIDNALPGTLCDFLNKPRHEQLALCPGLDGYPPLTRWGWHNRDYTIENTYASKAPEVVPGERDLGPLVNPAFGTDLPVWHFQDDAVSGDMFAMHLIDPFIHQSTWNDEHYVYSHPLCGVAGNVDGPKGIETYSKDLAFVLHTHECIVNKEDLILFALQWLDVGIGLTADFDSSGSVDNSDFGYLSEFWYDLCPPGWPLK